ncbi:hypothetical protein VCUG_00431 [Vavraia culicis subsp. floridensis]|uniref:Uncharacterized protein n=1 Tax=Vavraia culicis (isolate floridensis) TaxID=948595 RepID=L2GXJ7_VAVCU|nr:uncharacterized protein VCUG_00431 [Vavraia culicis subsp. floridensis]ELA48008.1 hypothetical protein VCUG_00431 [Vavraia culicis subsp. floridensis]
MVGIDCSSKEERSGRKKIMVDSKNRSSGSDGNENNTNRTGGINGSMLKKNGNFVKTSMNSVTTQKRKNIEKKSKRKQAQEQENTPNDRVARIGNVAGEKKTRSTAKRTVTKNSTGKNTLIPRTRIPPPLPYLTATESLIAQHGTIKDYLDLLTLKYLKTGDLLFVNELIDCGSVQRNDNVYYALCNLADVVVEDDALTEELIGKKGGVDEECIDGKCGQSGNNQQEQSKEKGKNSKRKSANTIEHIADHRTSTAQAKALKIRLMPKIINFFRLAMKNTFITSKATLVTASVVSKIPALIAPFILKIRNKETYRVVSNALLGMKDDGTINRELIDLFFKEDDWLVRMRIVYVMVGRYVDEGIARIYDFMVGVNERYGLCDGDDRGKHARIGGDKPGQCDGDDRGKHARIGGDKPGQCDGDDRGKHARIGGDDHDKHTGTKQIHTLSDQSMNKKKVPAKSNTLLLKPHDRALITQINDMLLTYLSKNNMPVQTNMFLLTHHNFSRLFSATADKLKLINTYLNLSCPTAQNLSLILNYVMESKNGKLLVKIIESGLNDECVRCFVERMRDVVVEKEVFYYVVGMKRHWNEDVRRCVDGILADKFCLR